MHTLPLTDLEFAIRAVMALVFGSLIGAERQWRQRTAGLRTNALVAVGACLFVLVTPLLGMTGNETQIAAYVVSGIGFLAGSVIFKERPSVTGLNTAATMWCTAAVGVLCGYGFVVQAAIGTAIVLFVHIVLRPLVALLNQGPKAGSDVVTSYEVLATVVPEVEDQVRRALVEAVKRSRMSLIAVYSEDTDARVNLTADVSTRGLDTTRLERIVTDVATQPGVSAISWRQVPVTDEEHELVDEV